MHDAPRREREQLLWKSGGRVSRHRERGGTTKPALGAPAQRRRQGRRERRATATAPREEAPRRHHRERAHAMSASRRRVGAAAERDAAVGAVARPSGRRRALARHRERPRGRGRGPRRNAVTVSREPLHAKFRASGLDQSREGASVMLWRPGTPKDARTALASGAVGDRLGQRARRTGPAAQPNHGLRPRRRARAAALAACARDVKAQRRRVQRRDAPRQPQASPRSNAASGRWRLPCR